MGENSNQQRENLAFNKEDAYQALSLINTWVSNIDTKTSFALALVGVLIGMIFSDGIPNAFQKIAEVSKLAELNGGEILAAILVVLLYLVSFLSAFCFMYQFSILCRLRFPFQWHIPQC